MRRPAPHPAAEAPGAEPQDLDPPLDEVGLEDEAPPSQEEVPPVDPQVLWHQARIASLERDLQARDEKLREYIAAYKKATGEMDAAQGRLERDRDKVIGRDRMDLVGKLLEVLDNFDRSIGSIRPDADLASIQQGLAMVRGQFAQVLSGFGVERIEARGRPFDATLHEAAGMVPAQPGQADQEVVFEERAGYLYQGKLLRAARVIIASQPG